MYKLSIFTILAVMFLITTSCCKAFVDIKTLIRNNSAQTIEIKLFAASGTTSFSITPEAETEAPYKLNGILADSIWVVRSGQVTEIHYPRLPANSSKDTRVIRYPDPGSLYNPDFYSTTTQELSCNGQITRFTYVFH